MPGFKMLEPDCRSLFSLNYVFVILGCTYNAIMIEVLGE